MSFSIFKVQLVLILGSELITNMKILKITLSLLIIFFTSLIITNLVKELNFNLYDYINNKYHFLFLTLLLQIFGVFFSSKRWRETVLYYKESKNILFSFDIYFFLNSRANLINNFLPSILFGDLSKLFSPNKSNKNKKTELKFIFADRIFGVFTLFNLGLISSTYLKFINLQTFFFIIITQFLFFYFLRKIDLKFVNIQSILVFIKNPPHLKVFVYSFLSQFFFSLSLLTQMYAFKVQFINFRDFFISIFLNSTGIIPFSINGWGVREWAAAKISLNLIENENLIISSVIFGICFSISSLLIFTYTSFFYRKNTKN